MKSWTDGQLEQLPRDTFRDHENLADPDRALAVALTTAPARRRRWPVIWSAAAAVALVVGGTVVRRHSALTARRVHRLVPHSADSPTPPGLGATDEENIAATRAQAAWILHAVPMPDGAEEWHEPPTAVLGEPGLGTCPSDSTLRPDDLVDGAAVRQRVRGLGRSPGPDRSSCGSEQGQVREHRALRRLLGADTAAFTTPTLAVNYIDRGDGTEVRLDTFISARYGRSTFIPTATHVTIRRTRESSDLGTDAVTTRQLSDPEEVAQVVALANRLPGVPSGDCVHSCPPVSGGIYTLRFLGPAGAIVLRATEDFCGIGATLRENGTFVDPLLDPDRSFFAQVDRLVRRR